MGLLCGGAARCFVVSAPPDLFPVTPQVGISKEVLMSLLLNLSPSMRAMIDQWVPLLSTYVHTTHGRLVHIVPACVRAYYASLCRSHNARTRSCITLTRVHMRVEKKATKCCRAALTWQRVMQGICAFTAQHGRNERNAVGRAVQVGHARMLSGVSHGFCLNTPVCVCVCVCVWSMKGQGFARFLLAFVQKDRKVAEPAP